VKDPSFPFKSWQKDGPHLPVVTEDLLDVGHLAQAEPLLVQATAAQKNKQLVNNPAYNL
jgi:hypothetical protein